ncbi:E3 SUMO-protein ligase ZBED1-like [Haliotis rubra]|uniref:E3 SUMO-protein ligase ZBED1-like n=1 Tax=Haliotis rubra TaxID=36100 RepID=UPI001EE5D590|nr:E3 SUMO-protein ligase ZBED1-like [Haliotis rubra]
MEDNHQTVIVYPPAKFKGAVWKYFGFWKIEGRTLENETICRICEHTINYTCKNTSNMAIHLRRKHAIETSNQGDKTSLSSTMNLVHVNGSVNKSSMGQLSIQSAFQTKLAPGSSRAQLITRNLALYIATDLRPYSIVESQGFKKLMNCLEPKYTLPSRTTLSRKVIPDLYEKVKEEVKAGLKASHSVALTTNGWTSRATQSYITITAHFIDDERELKNKVLQTRPIFDSHTGVNIADVFKQAIDDWELKRPHGQQPITSDSAANVCLAVDIAVMTPISDALHMSSILQPNKLFI